MKLNPCLKCARKNQNKNNPICRDCDKRIDYVNNLELNLNFSASYGDDQPASHRISFFSRQLFAVFPKEDVI